MADAATGFERGIETTGYSPVVSSDRGTTDRIIRSPAPPSDMHDGQQPDLASLLRHGVLKLEAGNDAEAEEFFRKALEIGDRTVGPDHPDMILLLNDLTRIYLKQSAYASAEPLLIRLLEMKRSKGEDHPEVATVMASLATVRQALGRHESAEQLWRRVLEIRERTLAPNHFAIATALEHFGEACSARGKIRDALAAFQRAHTIRERTLGSDHSSLRASRERIADLQLQASDGSFDPGESVGISSGPEKYRLLSGEPLALAAPTTPVREKGRTPNTRKPTLLIPDPFPESQAVDTASVADEAPASAAVPSQPETTTAAHREILERILQPEAAPYRDALESIREEVERPYEGAGFAERVRATLASVTPFLGKREVIAGGIVLVLSLLLVAVATGSHAWGETDQTTSAGSPPPTRGNLPAAAVAATSAPVVPGVAVSNNPVSVSAPAIPNAPSRTSGPRVAEERSTSKKGTEQKSDTRKIAIPKLSTATLSGLDSVAATAANTAMRADDPIINQPGPVVLGNQRSTFDFGEQAPTGPQRARLIGELPTPRVPSQVSDVEGQVRVRFTVDTDGRPVMSTLSVEASPNPLLTTAVRKVIPGIRFEPARSGGSGSKPISDTVEIGFRFARLSR
ncbi:MAG TPA: TonB family protein [Gemmatimonadaceae bacterium]